MAWNSTRVGHRQGLDRRTFLRVGTLGALGVSLADFVALQEAQAGQRKRRAKSVILIYTMGGISHHDSFDPKPDAPPEIRGEFKTIPVGKEPHGLAVWPQPGRYSLGHTGNMR